MTTKRKTLLPQTASRSSKDVTTAATAPVKIALLGFGTVGSSVARVLATSKLPGIELTHIFNRNVERKRTSAAAKCVAGSVVWTENFADILNSRAEIVVELMGGLDPAEGWIRKCLAAGKSVVTANKQLIAYRGASLFRLAAKHGVQLVHGAAVAGGVPVIPGMLQGLGGDQITRISGIVNGTCNFILSRMKLQGVDFAAAVAEAQRLGYAETPPDLDVDGHDAAHKIGILASLAHGFWINPKKIYTQGIRHVTQLDMKLAAQLGYTIKLLGIIKKPTHGSCVQVSVYPALVPNGHVMASVNDAYNAVLVRGDVVGDTLFYGQGAGKDATASAVLSDVADAALDLKFANKHRVPPFVPHECDSSVAPIAEVQSEFFVRLNVLDKPGVLARITAIFARNNIGISHVLQPRGREGEIIPLVLMLHRAPNGAVTRALKQIAGQPLVKGKPVMFRVENFQ